MHAVEPEVVMVIGFMSECTATIGCIVRMEGALEVDALEKKWCEAW
jgi:hypothetical protein